jgi:hypothetical protein
MRGLRCRAVHRGGRGRHGGRPYEGFACEETGFGFRRLMEFLVIRVFDFRPFRHFSSLQALLR